MVFDRVITPELFLELRKTKDLGVIDFINILKYLKIDKINPYDVNILPPGIDTGDNILTNKMHGDIARKHSAYTAKGNVENKGMSVFNNHTHRMGSYYKSDELGDRVGVECGCMCKLNPEYIDGTPNWQQGFAVIYKKKNSKWFQHYLVKATKGKFIWNGKLYK